MFPRSLEADAQAEIHDLREESSSQTTEPHDPDNSGSHDPSWISFFGLGAILFILGLALSGESKGAAAALELFGIIVSFAALVVWKAEARDAEARNDEEYANALTEEAEWEQAENAHEAAGVLSAEDETRRREIAEIVKAVKSTIRVRCKYCGTLNEESANNCESCGAAL